MLFIHLLWIFISINGIYSELRQSYSHRYRPRYSHIRHLVSSEQPYPLHGLPNSGTKSKHRLFNWDPMPVEKIDNLTQNRDNVWNEVTSISSVSTTELTTAPSTIKLETTSLSSTTSPNHNITKLKRKRNGNLKKKRLKNILKQGLKRSFIRGSRYNRLKKRKNKQNGKHKLKNHGKLNSTTESNSVEITTSKLDINKQKLNETKNFIEVFTENNIHLPKTINMNETIKRSHENEIESSNSLSLSNVVAVNVTKNVANVKNKTLQPKEVNELKTEWTSAAPAVLVGDMSCVKPFLLAPTVFGALVRYRRKEHHKIIYMIADYECKKGYKMTTKRSQLICKGRHWFGDVPKCLRESNEAFLTVIQPPCYEGRGRCDHMCFESNGTEVCSCYKGFKQDGHKCRDINECARNNGGCDFKCVNTLGSYHCKCAEGLRVGDEKDSCVDINECLLNNGHGPCQDTCTNTWGSFKCTCGFQDGLKGTKLAADGLTCEGTDECATGVAGCSHDCINLPLGRGAYCTCPIGWILQNDWKTCQDVDECLDPDMQDPDRRCAAGSCENFVGGYKCSDPFVSNDEPPLKVCPIGMKLNHSNNDCEDINECEIQNGGCAHRCINTEGSFHCACHSGYVFGPNKTSCIVGAAHIVCPPLYPPRYGYLECSRPHSHLIVPGSNRNFRYLRTRSGRRRVTNRPSTHCSLRCPRSFNVVGSFDLTCGYDGLWTGDRTGQCIRNDA